MKAEVNMVKDVFVSHIAKERFSFRIPERPEKKRVDGLLFHRFSIAGMHKIKFYEIKFEE